MPDMNDKFHADLHKHFEGRTDITPQDIRAFEDKWRSDNESPYMNFLKNMYLEAKLSEIRSDALRDAASSN